MARIQRTEVKRDNGLVLVKVESLDPIEGIKLLGHYTYDEATGFYTGQPSAFGSEWNIGDFDSEDEVIGWLKGVRFGIVMRQYAK